jgi:hypothetical protein
MYHSPVERDHTIHPSWCTCSDCNLGRKRSIFLDLKVIARGMGSALVVGALLAWFGPF